jgi:hypothetical protein
LHFREALKASDEKIASCFAGFSEINYSGLFAAGKYKIIRFLYRAPLAPAAIYQEKVGDN